MIRKQHSVLLGTLLLVACSVSNEQGPADPGDARGFDPSTMRWLDLTHPFDLNTIYWPNNPTGFELTQQFAGRTPGGWYYSSNKLCAPEHGGTHMDAPVHFAEQGLSVDRVPVDQLVGSACVIHLSDSVGDDADHQVNVAQILAWEAINGPILAGSIVLLHTGWDRFYDDRIKCLGTDEHGEAAIPKLHFPGIDPELAQWLVDHRRPKAVGLDTPSLDYGQSRDFLTHRILAGAGVCGLENVSNLGALPATGAFVMALPMKIRGGTGGPLRIVAGLPA